MSKFTDYIAIIFVLFLISLALINRPYDSTDDRQTKTRSGLTLRIDHGTGCEYLVGGILASSITPRLNANGTQVCN